MNVELSPLSDHTGVEARGVDLSKPLDDATRATLNQAFVDASVLVIRDQSLTADQLLVGVRNFGEIFPQHNTRFALPDCPQIHYLSNQDSYQDGTRYIPGEGYHTDHSNSDMPPKATVLLALELPDSGGDTQYVNMARAYEDLPESTKQRIAELKGMHVYQSKYSERKLMGLTDEAKKSVPDAVVHPIVRTHPESGRKAIYINPIRIEEIEGMAEADTLNYQSKYSERKLMGLTDEAKKSVPDAVVHPIVRTHPESGRKAIYINPIRIEEIEGMAEVVGLEYRIR